MKRNVLIVGASGDIGIAIAEQLSNEGYQLILHYNSNRKGLEQFLSSAREDTVLDVIQADLSTSEGIDHFLSRIHLPVDCIVFASGTAYFGLLQETPEAVMDSMLTLHVKAVWMISKHLLHPMIRRKEGKIVLITSVWGEAGASNEVIYSSVKGAQNSFVKALAKETGPSGINVNAVSPGFIETKMNGHLTLEERSAISEEIPLNRPGEPMEVAHAVSFLLDEKSAYIHGEIINVTGGW